MAGGRVDSAVDSKRVILVVSDICLAKVYIRRYEMYLC